MGYAKVIHKKRKREKRKMMMRKMDTKAFEISKTTSTHMPARKKKR